MIPGITSTGSKRPDLLFGAGEDVPQRMVRSNGCRIWTEDGRELIDMSMALGAVSLGYGHDGVVRAVTRAVQGGLVGPLPPTSEDTLAGVLAERFRPIESVRFFKTGAEAVAAAVRVARVVTGRRRIVTCGYQGWHDQFSSAMGVPSEVAALRTEVAFGDVAGLEAACSGDDVAALVLEPVVDGPPTDDWVRGVDAVAGARGVPLILDEIKTGLRLGWTAAERFGYTPQLIVLGKALGNGMPLAVVGGGRDVMDGFTRTWVSSTLSTESASLAAALAVVDAYACDGVARRLAAVGAQFHRGLQRLGDAHGLAVRGIPELCYLDCGGVERGHALSRACMRRGVLFKRDAYNFVSFAHTPDVIDHVLEVVGESLDEVGPC